MALSDPLLARYLAEVAALRAPTPVEERSLRQRIATGDRAALHELVKAHLQLVVTVSRYHRRSGVDPLDLIEAGNLALVQAAQSLDLIREDQRFAAFARAYITAAMTERERGTS